MAYNKKFSRGDEVSKEVANARRRMPIRWAMAGIALLGLVAGACGSSGSSSGAAAKGQSGSTGKVTGTISYLTWTAGPQVDQATKNAAKTYMRLHPGTTINVTILPFDQYEQKVELLAASHSLPDIFQEAAGALRFIHQGLVLNLDNYIKKDPVLSNPKLSRTWIWPMAKFGTKHIEAFQQGGVCGMQLYYNRSLFKAAHVAYPTDKWTWTDFRRAAQKLTIQKNGRTVQYGADIGYLGGWDGGWQTIAASNGMKTFTTPSVFGPRHINFEQPAVINAWQFIQDLIYKYHVAPTPSTDKALSQSGGSAFESGKIAMVPDGCWQLGGYKLAIKHLGMARLPRGTTGKSIGPVWGTYMFIAKSSHYPTLAYDFLRWITVNDREIKAYAKASGWCGPGMVKSTDKLYAASWRNIPGGKACISSLTGARNFAITGTNWDQISTNVVTPMFNDRFLQDKMSAKTLAADLQKKVNAALGS